jgi:hypothetical protein
MDSAVASGYSLQNSTHTTDNRTRQYYLRARTTRPSVANLANLGRRRRHDNPDQPPLVPLQPLRKLFPSTKAREASAATTDEAHCRQPFWPRDLLADDLPEARIWTYGYNADVINTRLSANTQKSVTHPGRDLANKAECGLEDEVGTGSHARGTHS